MIIENSQLKIDFAALPFPVQYEVREKSVVLSGAHEAQSLTINSTTFPLSQLSVNWENTTATITAGDFKFSLFYTLSNDHLSCKVTPLEGHIQCMDFTGMTFLEFGEGWSYAKDFFLKQQWHSPIGRGLNVGRFEAGEIVGAFPQTAGEHAVHACGFSGDCCGFLRTDYAVAPLFTRLYPHPKYQVRSGKFSISLNRLFFDLKDVQFDSWQFTVHFTGDQNGDGVADENDYQLALKDYLKKPCSFYEERYVYKVMCAVHGNKLTSFQEALQIAAYISKITRNKKQLMYLVGWQYTGHDSGYPSFDKINESLGSVADLEHLIKIAKEQYNTIVSVHANIDDSYREHPGFREDVIARDIDGSIMTWEVFGNKQSYHINHTKDVRSGGIFKRVDDLFQVMPLTGSVHFDAMRNTNFSWEEDEFIGADKEWYCGIKPIHAYLNQKGCDISTESLNGMVVEITDAYSHIYHNFKLWPVLYHGSLYGGGNGHDPFSLIFGSNSNDDFVYSMIGDGEILDMTVMYHLLYQYLLNRKMIYNKSGWGKGISRFSDGTIAEADNGEDFLSIVTDETLVADKDSRFIPLKEGIFIYQRTAGTMVRTLPAEYENCQTTIRVVNQGSEQITYRIDGRRFVANLPARTLIILTKAGE